MHTHTQTHTHASSLSDLLRIEQTGLARLALTHLTHTGTLKHTQVSVKYSQLARGICGESTGSAVR